MEVTKIPKWFSDTFKSGAITGKKGIDGVDGNDGRDGVDGISICSATVVGDRFVLGMSDGNILDIGSADFFKFQEGPQGNKGDRGEQARCN